MSYLGSDAKAAYKAIKAAPNSYGIFRKAYFHIHTPASHDYKFLNEWEKNQYQSASALDIFQICIKRGIFTQNYTLEMLHIPEDYTEFQDEKEFLSYLALADSLIKKRIEIVVVADHNTIAGFEKLQIAINALANMKKPSVSLHVVLGIEISCADRNHIVGIFPNTHRIKTELTSWLDTNLINKELGTYKTGLDVLEFISQTNGIGYIAHIDTADIFKGDKYLSEAYRLHLFASPYAKIIGIKDISRKEYFLKKIQQYRKDEIIFVLDNDSHAIDEREGAFFWIKYSHFNYRALHEALTDYDISIAFTSESHSAKIIKGLFIEKTNDGFLSGKNENEPFCLSFSPALNCLIGGRGTGKSSILEMLEFILGQKCIDENRLEFLCQHGNSWILYEVNQEEYLVELRTPVKNDESDSILQYLGKAPRSKYYYSYTFDPDTLKNNLLAHYLTVARVKHTNNGDILLETLQNKRKFLAELFDTSYSVNQLVQTASNGSIGDFISRTILQNKQLSHPEHIISCRSINGLSKLLDDVANVRDKRNEEVYSEIKPFNAQHKSSLRIVYRQNKKVNEPPLEEWLFGNRYDENAWYNGFNIKQQDIAGFFYYRLSAHGLFGFLRKILHNEFLTEKDEKELLSLASQMDQKMIDLGISAMKLSDAQTMLEDLNKRIVSDITLPEIIQYLKYYVRHSEEFGLEFNVNSHGSNAATPIFRAVENLSLGQKVVAMLTFILAYGEISNDSRPLIIDQPEDNLDSQYIYHNLVSVLRKVKQSRQVIIATHNATIVTNSKADQVCVMESNNTHGWISTSGYPSDLRIKKEILNYLEGGKDSFKHKIAIYGDAL